ncbi:LacI family DNA-binding transcriptional regulator [uncultured Enterococcus sp.]|uniref:LacI family DNA-binding transcriptional regulator n=1 Tax=uncultured Enterococcus sp. TaxID=167972 RepID=UPI0025D4FEF3|nr:LacI family DNA-binding transcriptional regulator [uncultured Enterococcus sp.]
MATIKQVAERAGLSVATVSRYLNNHPYISEEKREKIKQAMLELDYTPSSIATQLRSKKNTMIGVVVSRLTNPFFSYLIDTIEQQAKKQGYQVLIMQTYDDEHAQLKMLELLKQHVISGVILCSVEGKIETIEQYLTYGPIVLCNEEIRDSRLPQVFTRQEEATFNATEYLIKKGYHKISYCTGGTLVNGGHGNARTTGFERALHAHQLSIQKDWIFKQVHTKQDGENVARKLLTMPTAKQPDAIFTSSDEVASGVLKVYLEAGKSIPADLAILGFDNQPYSDLLAVPLTTIEQPVKGLGEEATNLLLAKIEEKKYHIKEEHLVLKLIKRKSV